MDGSVTYSNVAPPSSTTVQEQSYLDLGALIKDLGLDLQEEEQQHSSPQSTVVDPSARPLPARPPPPPQHVTKKRRMPARQNGRFSRRLPTPETTPATIPSATSEQDPPPLKITIRPQATMPIPPTTELAPIADPVQEHQLLAALVSQVDLPTFTSLDINPTNFPSADTIANQVLDILVDLSDRSTTVLSRHILKKLLINQYESLLVSQIQCLLAANPDRSYKMFDLIVEHCLHILSP